MRIFFPLFLFPIFLCANVDFSLSFLLWQAKISGLEFAAKSFLPSSSAEGMKQKLFLPDFAWRPGLKANVGMTLPHFCWELEGNWTYYHNEFTSLKKHFTAQIVPSGVGVIPMWRYPFFQIDPSGEPIRYGVAKGNGKLFFNSVSLELCRLFYPEASLPIRLHLGLLGAWIRLFDHAEYENGNTVQGIIDGVSTPLQLFSSHFQFSSHQWGIGPRLGLGSRWSIWNGVSLIADSAVSALASFYHLRQSFDDIVLPLNSFTRKQSNRFREITPAMEAMLGGEYGVDIFHTHLTLSVGFEWQYWWSINHAPRYYVQALPGSTFDMRGDVQMQGLNATVQLDF